MNSKPTHQLARYRHDIEDVGGRTVWVEIGGPSEMLTALTGRNGTCISGAFIDKVFLSNILNQYGVTCAVTPSEVELLPTFATNPEPVRWVDWIAQAEAPSEERHG